MADNGVAVVISLKCLEKQIRLSSVTHSQLKRSSDSFIDEFLRCLRV